MGCSSSIAVGTPSMTQRLHSRARPSSAKPTCSAPLSSTASPHKATRMGRPAAVPGASRGSATSWTTSVASVSAVADDGPVTGAAVRLSAV